MSKRAKKYACRLLQIFLGAIILGGFAAAQKAQKTLSAEDYYKRGAARMERGDYTAALANLEKAIRLNPKEAKFYFKRGEIREESGEFSEAIGNYNKAIELKPDYVEAYAARAIWYSYDFFRDASYRQSVADFERAISLAPNRAETFVARAEYFYLRPSCPEIEAGLADLAHAVRLNPRIAEPYFVSAEFYRRLGEYDRAIADATTAVKINPRRLYGFQLRAGYYVKIGKHDEAIADYTVILKSEPKNADILERRAAAYREIGSDRLADADERKVIKLRAPESHPIAGVTSALSQPKTFTEQELGDSYIDSYNLYGALLDVKKLKNLPREEVKRLTQICFADNNFEGGNTNLNEGKYEQAIADYTAAAILNPATNSNYYNNRGIAYAKIGDYDQALTNFSNARALNYVRSLKKAEPGQKNYGSLRLSDSEIFYNTGLVLIKKGDFEEAVKALTNSLKLVPERIGAYQLRAKALRRLGKIPEAEADEQTIKRLTTGK